MFDANNWIGAADYGSFFKTTDGGITWKTSSGGYVSTLYPGTPCFVNFKSGWFFDMNTGVLGCQSVKGIARTTNGGTTFDTIFIGSTNSTTYGFYFINSMTGYLAGSSGFKVQKTTNSGLNWSAVPNLGSLTFYSVYASDTNNIIAASTSGNVYITSNAGVNWTTVNVGSTGTIYQMKFINANTGYLCGSNGLFRYTTNGGLNWTGTNVPATGSLYNISVSGNDVIVSGLISSQDIFKTTDNGNTWTVLNYANSGQITTALAYSMDKIGNTIITAGSFGIMMRSTNNGINWTCLSYNKTVANLTDIYAQNGNGKIIITGVNSGTNDVITYSNDGGVNWNSSNYFATDYVNNIDMLNANTGYICGRYGRFAKTTNGGISWDTTLNANPVLSSYFCNGLDFINENTGWIAGGLPSIGGNSRIWKTTNGGVNWTEQFYLGSPVGVRIKMVNENIGYVSLAVSIFKTTNSGVNWFMVASPAPISGVSYSPLIVIDSLNVFTAGSNSQVYATSNGGLTWDSLNYPIKTGTIFTVDFINANTGVAAGIFGTNCRTTNRGQSWEIMSMGGYTTQSIKMVHPDTIFAVTGNAFGGMVFKYAKGLTGGIIFENNSPAEFTLKQNYPNPFNPVTTIEFSLPKTAKVTLNIFDVAGRLVKTELNNLTYASGNYKITFDGSNLSSGVYFYSLLVDDNKADTKKMVLIK
jgi:photosystem II stability/assembly factor-like uncharacterized protein